MTTNTTNTEPDGLAVIANVTQLLDAAADQCLSLLSADPLPVPEDSFALSDLGLGARLAAHLARDLLPAHVDLGAPTRNQGDPLDLVRAAEALTRTVPVEALPAGSSQLVVALCDLLSEHP